MNDNLDYRPIIDQKRIVIPSATRRRRDKEHVEEYIRTSESKYEDFVSKLLTRQTKIKLMFSKCRSFFQLLLEDDDKEMFRY